MRRIVVLGFALVAAVGFGAPASADPGRGADIQCYLWAHQASSAIGVAYTPSATYSFNAAGRASANSVTRTALGVYTVRCEGVGGNLAGSSSSVEAVEGVSTNRVSRDGEPAGEGELKALGSWGPGGHVQVTAYGGEDADQCKVVSWTTGGRDFSATVRCYNHAGALADSRFDLLFVW
jgi:hypothetical protein